MFASIRVYAGLDSTGGFLLATDKDTTMMVQACLVRCIECAVLCDEFFMQLARMTRRPDLSRAPSKEVLQTWKLFWYVRDIILL
jgi:hypothetical protein